MSLKIKFILIVIFLPSIILSQDNLVNCTDSLYCVPGVNGMARTKGLVLEYERVLNFAISSNSNDTTIGNGNAHIDRNRRIKFKAKVPLWNKPDLKLIAGFQYFREEYRFDDFGIPEYSLYKSLENKSLNRIGGALYAVKLWKGQRYFLLKIAGNISGDYTLDDLPKSYFLKFSIAPLFGWKKNENLAYGFGFAYSHAFGRPRIYPLLVYNRTFNNFWGLEALVPADVKLRFNFYDHTIMYAGVKLNGASYNIHLNEPVLSNIESLQLRKSEIRYQLVFEKAIYDWIWFGITTGFRTNIEFGLSKSNALNSDNLINSQLDNAFFLNASIFFVPPKKYLK